MIYNVLTYVFICYNFIKKEMILVSRNRNFNDRTFNLSRKITRHHLRSMNTYIFMRNIFTYNVRTIFPVEQMKMHSLKKTKIFLKKIMTLKLRHQNQGNTPVIVAVNCSTHSDISLYKLSPNVNANFNNSFIY